MGREICVCLSSSNPVDRCNPWRDISSGVGNSSAQTVDDHVLVNGRTRKRSAAGDRAKRKSVRKSCRSAGDPAWKTMWQHREDAAGWGAVTELLLAGALQRRAIGKKAQWQKCLAVMLNLEKSVHLQHKINLRII